MGFTLHYLKKQMTEHCSSLVHDASELPSLHYNYTVVLHSCIILPPVGHSSNHEYHCCQLTRQSSCVSNFYCTFEVFIWLSLVIMRFFLTTFHFIWGKGICQWFPLTTNMYSMSLILSRCATNYDEFTCHLNVYLAQYSLLVTYVNIMQALKRSFGSTCHKQSLIFYSK